MIKGAIARPVTVSMVLLAISLFGYISLDRLALNLLPDISYPTLTIQTEYTDAAPEEVESLITRPHSCAGSAHPRAPTLVGRVSSSGRNNSKRCSRARCSSARKPARAGLSCSGGLVRW